VPESTGRSQMPSTSRSDGGETEHHDCQKTRTDDCGCRERHPHLVSASEGRSQNRRGGEKQGDAPPEHPYGGFGLVAVQEAAREAGDREGGSPEQRDRAQREHHDPGHCCDDWTSARGSTGHALSVAQRAASCLSTSTHVAADDASWQAPGRPLSPSVPNSLVKRNGAFTSRSSVSGSPPGTAARATQASASRPRRQPALPSVDAVIAPQDEATTRRAGEPSCHPGSLAVRRSA
jgi:hypothetical protein